MNRAQWTLGVAILAVSLSGCGVGEHSHNDSVGKDGEPATERPTIAVTNWTEKSELFMEYPTLVAGESGRFAIHVTALSDFKPLTMGEAVVVLHGADGREFEFRGGISRPGIFGADVRPEIAGTFDMTLRIETPVLEDLHDLGQVIVNNPDLPFTGEPEDEDGSISFLKEQQWALDFGTEQVSIRSLKASLLVPGTVTPRAGGEAALEATVPGRVDPSQPIPVPGSRVRKGSLLARILPRSDEFQDPAGLRAGVVDAEQDYELARVERDRLLILFEEKIVSEKELLEAKAEFIATKAELVAARQRIERLDAHSQATGTMTGSDWFAIKAPFDGVIADVHMTPGANVDEGDLLLRLVDVERVHVVGAVPESSASVLRAIGDAELIRDGQAPVRLGSALAIGEIVEPVTRMLEVRFALDNRQLGLPVGLRVQVRLFIGNEESLPSVPLSAIIDDGGRPVVFIQLGGESFERRSVRLGNREGSYTHVLEGVHPGERVVSRGAYLIRLAAMSTNIPSHGHVH